MKEFIFQGEYFPILQVKFPILQVKDEFSFLYYLFKYEKSEILIFKYEKTHSTHIENSCHKTLYYLFRRMSYLNM